MQIAAESAGLRVDRLYTYSADAILWTTIKSYLRHCWYIPKQLTGLIDPIALPFVRKYARRRDARSEGEEIVFEARL